jgi:hypothetical protein
MTTRTRYFVVCSLLIMTVGIGTGLVAYYSGFKLSVLAVRGGPDELQYIPRDVAVVAYADVHQIMTSELRQKIRAAIPAHENGRQEFENQTGINIETDIDRIVACVEPSRTGTSGSGNNIPESGLVLARGRFNDTKIESLMRAHGATVEMYNGKRLIVTTHVMNNENAAPAGAAGQASMLAATKFAAAFIEPGLVGVGSAGLVQSAIDAQATGRNVTTNDDVMNLIRSLETGNAWAVGRFDVLQAEAKLPADVSSRIPPITWFSVSGNVNGGIRGVVRAETRDEESAKNLRDVVRGFMALAKLQTSSNPQLQTMVQSLELGGTGKTVALSFVIPADAFDALSGIHGAPGPRSLHGTHGDRHDNASKPNQPNR